MLKIILVAIALGLSSSSMAGFVSPLKVDLGETRRAQLMYTNDSDTPILIEVSAIAWAGDGKPKMRFDPNDLVVMPQVVEVAAGEAQAITIVTAADWDSFRSYRILLTEVAQGRTASGVKLNISYSIPVYDWAGDYYDSSEEVVCSNVSEHTRITNSSNNPIRISRELESILPIRTTLCSGQYLDVSAPDLNTIEC